MEVKILVVDDAMFMRRIIKNALSSGGYNDFAEADDGTKAVTLYKQYKPDLVLLDITMPGKSGLEVLSEILSEDRKAKVVMCSAIGQEETIEKAVRIGAVDYITKPFKNEEILEVIKNTLK